MESRAKILGHPVHQVVVMFPIGMLGFAAVCDAAYAITRDRRWPMAARAAIGATLVGAGIAAPFGLLDYLSIPKGTRAKTIGRAHGLGNAALLQLLLGSYAARRRRPSSKVGRGLAAAGLAVAGLTAWLGTELVIRLGIGTSERPNPDAPSSLEGGRLYGRARARVSDAMH